ncbi:unnamed protein product [Closterium sp. Naga37s-1]|nr:unnamed protein product [Closterium sp. Naga37s-1]
MSAVAVPPLAAAPSRPQGNAASPSIALNRAASDGQGTELAKGDAGNACGGGEADVLSAEGKADGGNGEENAEGEAGKWRVIVGLQLAPSKPAAATSGANDDGENAQGRARMKKEGKNARGRTRMKKARARMKTVRAKGMMVGWVGLFTQEDPPRAPAGRLTDIGVMGLRCSSYFPFPTAAFFAVLSSSNSSSSSSSAAAAPAAAAAAPAAAAAAVLSVTKEGSVAEEHKEESKATPALRTSHSALYAPENTTAAMNSAVPTGGLSDALARSDLPGAAEHASPYHGVLPPAYLPPHHHLLLPNAIHSPPLNSSPTCTFGSSAAGIATAASSIDAAASFNQSSSATSAAAISGSATGNGSPSIALHRAESDGQGMESAKGDMIGNSCGHAEAEGKAKGEAEVSSAEGKVEENAEGDAGKSRVVVGLRQLGMATSVAADVTPQ